VERLVVRIAQRFDHRLIGTGKRALHVVRQRRQTHRFRRVGCDAIEPFERLEQVVAIVG
jgi:hypothetical protein